MSFNVSSFTAWRAAFVVPAIFQAVTAIMVLAYGQDLPSGNYKRSRATPKENFFKILFNGLKNYRAWILALAYGYSFGVELTTDNVIAQYFYERFDLNLELAGTVAASFGMANFFSRPTGGLVSDEMGKRFGMRGRLWALWVVQTVAGLLCVLLGRVNSLWGSIAVMCCFSVFVQAASGLTFGVVPFVSKRLVCCLLLSSYVQILSTYQKKKKLSTQLRKKLKNSCNIIILKEKKKIDIGVQMLIMNDT